MSATQWMCVFVVAVLAARGNCAAFKKSLSAPKGSSTTTTLRLTAQRNDTGSWTTKFGDYQMTIEHKHFSVPVANETDDGTWTLKVKHTSTIFEEDTEAMAGNKSAEETHEQRTDMEYSPMPDDIGNENGISENDPEDNIDGFQIKPDEEGREDNIHSENDMEPQIVNPTIISLDESPDSNNVRVLEEVKETVPTSNNWPRFERLSTDDVTDSQENRQAFRILEERPGDEEGVETKPSIKTILDILARYNNSNGIQPMPPVESHTLESHFSTSTTTEEPFIAGVQIDEVPHISRVPDESQPVFGDVKNEDVLDPDLSEMTIEDREHYLAAEERRRIMENYPRSRSLGLREHEREQELEEKGYQYYSQVGWLKLNTAHWQWDQARKSCEMDGGHLAVPDTLFKIRTFTRVLKNNSHLIERAVLKNQVFVGVYDPKSNGRFTTIKGEPFIAESVSIWFPNEPNHAPPGEDCVTLHIEGKLRDVPCFFNLPFLCQID